MKLHVERFGRGQPLVVLHGFTGSSAAMGELTMRLADQFEIVAFDLPGHGRSAAIDDPARYRPPRLVDECFAALDALGVGRAAWFGYSMGGRLALRAALARPQRVRALVLLGVSPGIGSDAERAERRRSDDALAADLERDGIAAFAERWEAQPLFATERTLPPERLAAVRAHRRANDAAGLARSLRSFGAGTLVAVDAELPGLTVPLLVLAGEHDARYVADAQRFGVAPSVRVDIVPGAGHAAHLEAPGDVAARVRAFVAGAP